MSCFVFAVGCLALSVLELVAGCCKMFADRCAWLVACCLLVVEC